MVQFHIQTDSEIPASTQLYDQIWFAIASRQYPPGYRLPSTRQLAMQTGLHRNTISKVYRQLEEAGVVEAQPGSGIYVRTQGNVEIAKLPAAVAGDTHLCALPPKAGPHPPNPFVGGSQSVKIGGRPALRLGDKASCGAVIVSGCSTVLIGG